MYLERISSADALISFWVKDSKPYQTAAHFSNECVRKATAKLLRSILWLSCCSALERTLTAPLALAGSSCTPAGRDESGQKENKQVSVSPLQISPLAKQLPI